MQKCSGLTNTWLAHLIIPGNREKYKLFEDTKPAEVGVAPMSSARRYSAS